MKVLILAEGDPETRDAWSGIVKSVLDQLRALGHDVGGGDVELHGLDRWVVAAGAFALPRRRWRMRFRLGSLAFRARSRNARRTVRAHRGRAEAILQIGATFDPGPTEVPLFLFCDSNIRMSQAGAGTGVTEAAALRPGTIRRVDQREAALYRRAAGIFTLSERARRSFLDDFGVPAERVHAVHAGPNFPVQAIPRDRPAPDPKRPPTILFVGRDFARKGGESLLEAFRIVRRTLADARLLVIGPDHLPPAEGVHCIGFLDKDVAADRARLVEAYQDADVFCLPTRFEPLGIVFIEAMHFGLPCVGTAVWAVPEMVVDGETGFLVPPDAPDVLAERLVRLLQDPAVGRRMGAAGARRARELFTWEAVTGRIAAVMRQTVAARG